MDGEKSTYFPFGTTVLFQKKQSDLFDVSPNSTLISSILCLDCTVPWINLNIALYRNSQSESSLLCSLWYKTKLQKAAK